VVIAPKMAAISPQGAQPASDTSEKSDSKAGPTSGATVYSDSLATGNITGAGSGGGDG
jgi:hypothetical protein